MRKLLVVAVLAVGSLAVGAGPAVAANSPLRTVPFPNFRVAPWPNFR